MPAACCRSAGRCEVANRGKPPRSAGRCRGGGPNKAPRVTTPRAARGRRRDLARSRSRRKATGSTGGPAHPDPHPRGPSNGEVRARFAEEGAAAARPRELAEEIFAALAQTRCRHRARTPGNRHSADPVGPRLGRRPAPGIRRYGRSLGPPGVKLPVQPPRQRSTAGTGRRQPPQIISDRGREFIPIPAGQRPPLLRGHEESRGVVGVLSRRLVSPWCVRAGRSRCRSR